MKRTLSILGTLSLLAPSSVFAAASTKFSDFGGMMDSICATLPFCSFNDNRGVGLIGSIGYAVVGTILPIVGMAAIASIAYGGVKMIYSGDESGTTEARKIILTSIIGALIALVAAGIVQYFYNSVIPSTT